jgi:uncharacterized protein YrrD
MNRASNYIGKPIFTEAGEPLDTINDVIFDPRTHQILCFVVEPGGWSGGTKILPWNDEHSITSDAVIVSSHEQVVLARKVPDIQQILETAQVVVGKQMIAPDEHQLGILNDVYFDAKTGTILEYEISIGNSSTTVADQRIMLQPDDVEFEMRRGTKLQVSATTAELLEQHVHTE